MEKQIMVQYVEDLIREELRKGRLVKGKTVLETLPGLVDAVCIDTEQLRSSIEQCLETKNPLNALLNLFGIQLIKREATINSLLFQGGAGDPDGETEEAVAPQNWITLDPAGIQAVVDRTAEALIALETQADQDFDEEKARRDSLYDKHDKLLKAYSQLESTAAANEKMVAQRVQHMLGQNGPDAAQNQQLLELLEDLNIRAYWDSTRAPFTDASMFTEYAVDDDVLLYTKPCLVKGEDVYCKGVRLIHKK